MKSKDLIPFIGKVVLVYNDSHEPTEGFYGILQGIDTYLNTVTINQQAYSPDLIVPLDDPSEKSLQLIEAIESYLDLILIDEEKFVLRNMIDSYYL